MKSKRKCRLLFIGIFYISTAALISFDTSEDGEYKEKEYFDTACNCFVRETYFPNGGLFQYEQFVDSITWLKNGTSIFFYETGDTADVTYFSQGKINGISYNKFQNGRIGILRNYEDDKPIGV